MYYYLINGYVIYRVWKYSRVIEYVISTGNSIKSLYRWIHPKREDENQYLDWILIIEDENSSLKKKLL